MTSLAMTVIPMENQLWFSQLIEDCKDIVTETEFASRWALVEGYHQLGIRILKDNESFEHAKVYGQEIVQRVAESLNKKTRTVYYAIRFAKEYPDLNLLPEGKNISWHHVINKYLTEGKETTRKLTSTEVIKAINKLLQDEWNKANQESNEDRKDFIRYLQDQIDKINAV